MDVVRHSNGGECTGHIDVVGGGGELVVSRTQVHIGGVVSTAILVEQSCLAQAAGKMDAPKDRIFGILDVGDLIKRHPQFVMGAVSGNREVAGTHAHDVRLERPGREENGGRDAREHGRSHRRSPTGESCAAMRDLRIRTYRTRTSARMGTERNVPGIPAISAPANTPNSTNSGWSATPCSMRCGERM